MHDGRQKIPKKISKALHVKNYTFLFTFLTTHYLGSRNLLFHALLKLFVLQKNYLNCDNLQKLLFAEKLKEGLQITL